MITGSGIAKQRALAARLHDAESINGAILADVSEVALEMYRLGFAGERDPDGQAWAKTKGGGPILAKTGELAGATVDVRTREFRLRSARHGYFAQFGWIPGRSRRSLLKEARAGLGPRPGKGSSKEERRAFRSLLSKSVRERRASLIAGGAAHVPPRRIQPSGSDLGTWGAPMFEAARRAARPRLGGAP